MSVLCQEGETQRGLPHTEEDEDNSRAHTTPPSPTHTARVTHAVLGLIHTGGWEAVKTRHRAVVFFYLDSKGNQIGFTHAFLPNFLPAHGKNDLRRIHQTLPATEHDQFQRMGSHRNHRYIIVRHLQGEG